jgi:Chaperone of endosialidase
VFSQLPPPRTTVNDILVQSILKRLTNLENRAVVTGPIQQFITNTYTGGVSYSVPADTTSYTNTTVNSAVNSAVTSLQEQINLVSSSASATNTFAFILATSTTATSTFSGNVNVGGDIDVDGNITAASFYGDGSNLTGITSFSTSTTRGVFSAGANLSYDSVNGVFSFASTTARGMLSSSATGLTYNNSTGDFSLTSGYNIPLTASTTEWASKVSSQWTTTGSDIYYTTGNVGIGTASPVNVFDIVKSDGTNPVTLNVQNTIGNTSGMAQLMLGTRTTVGDTQVGAKVKAQRTDTGSAGTTDLSFSVSSGTTMTERMRIMGNGNIGIGTTSPSAKFAITGTAGTGDIFRVASSTDASLVSINYLGALTLPVGSAGAPSINFGNGGGVFSVGGNRVSLVSGYNELLRADLTALLSFVPHTFYGNINIGSSADLSLSRNSAGVAEITSGTSGVWRDLIVRNISMGTTTVSSAISLNASTTASGGINFGDSTANLYRSAAGTIKTDGSIVVAGNLNYLGGQLGNSITGSGFIGTGSNFGITLQSRSFTAAGTAVTMSSGTFSNSSGQVNSVAITPTYNQTSTGAGTDLLINRTETAIGSGNQFLIDAQVGGTSKFAVTNTGVLRVAALNTTAGSIQGLDNSTLGIGISSGNFNFANYAYIVGTQNTFRVKSSIALGFSTDVFNSANDVAISRVSSGVIGIGTGSAGTYDGTLLVNTIGIATSTPGYAFTLAGDANITGALRFNGDPGTSGYVLQSTATGAQWVATSSLGISGGGGGSGTVDSGTAGQVAFYGSTGTAISGTSTLFFSNGNIGVGTTTPSAKLAITGTAGTGDIFVIASSTDSRLLTVTSAGKLGLGNSAPDATLHVDNKGLTGYTDTTVYDVLKLSNTRNDGTGAPKGSNFTIGLSRWNTDVTNYPRTRVDFKTTNLTTDSNSTSNTIMSLRDNWTVGVGSTDPGTVVPNGFDINGNNSALEIAGRNASAGDALLSLFRFDKTTGLQIWHDGSSWDSFIDNYYNSDDADLHFRTKTGGTPVNALTIKGNGNIGVGTTTPGYGLVVSGNSDTLAKGPLYIASTNANTYGTGFNLDATAAGGRNYSITAGGSSAYNPNGWAVYDSASSTYRLSINASGYTTVGAITAPSGSSASQLGVRGNTSIGSTYFQTAAPTNGLLVEGNVGIGTTTPGSALTVVGTTTVAGILHLPNVSIIRSSTDNVLIASSSMGTIFLGGAGSTTSSGTHNVGIGSSALTNVSSSGAYNIGIGYRAGTAIISATRTISIGANAGDANQISPDNVAIGYDALTAMNGTSLANTAVGNYALSGLTTNSHYNVALGMKAGSTLTSGVGNIIIGSGNNGDGVSTPSTTSSNTLNIGGVLWGTGMNSVTGSSIAAGNIGIGTSTPSARLAIAGASGASTDLLRVASSTGSPLFAISSAGNVGVGSVPNSLYAVSITGGLLITGTANAFGAGAIGMSSNALTFAGGSSGYDFRSSANSPQMTLSSGGNLGIGTTTPSAKLAVTGTAGTSDIFNIASSTNASLFKIASTGATYFNNDAGTAGYVLLSNGTGSSPTWVATSTLGISGGGGSSQWITTGSDIYYDTGNVGIGHASDGYKLDVYDLSGGDIASFGADAEKNLKISWSGINTYYQGDPSSLSLNANGGNVGIGTTTPGSSLTVAGTTTIAGPLQVVMPTTGALIIGDITGNARGTGAVDLQIRTSAAQVASGLNSVAVGYKNTADGVQGSAFGTENNAAGNWSLSAGYYNTANGTKSIAVGNENNVGTNMFSIGIGNNNVVSNTYSSGIGYSNTVSGYYAMAVGMGLTNGISNSVMIGPSQSSAATILSTGEFKAPFFNATSTTATSTFAGYVGIGTTTPGSLLTVAGNVSITGGITIPVTTSGGLGVVTMGSSRFVHGYGGTQTNVFMGPSAGNLTNTGRDAVGIGSNALVGLTSARLAVAIGSGALERNSSGWSNTAIGESSLNFVTTNGNNTAVGRRALYGTTGANNTAIGTQAGESASSGSDNIYVGYLAGDNLTTGSTNIIIGTNIDFASTTASNQLNIGNLIFSQGITGTGTTLSTGNIGIGTTTPTNKLDVNGSIRSFSSAGNIGVAAYYSGSGGREYSLLSCMSCGSASLGGLEIYDATAAATRAYIQPDVNGWQTPSDIRLKDNIETLSVLERIDMIRGTSYTLKNSGVSQIGVIAQEIKLAFPEAVSGEEVEGKYLGVSYNAIASIALQGVKELNSMFKSTLTKVELMFSWFGTDGDRFNVKGMVCVDDVCVTKDQFKQLLINSGSASVISSPPAQNTPPSTGDTSIEENNTSTSTTQSSGGGETPVQSTSKPPVETDNDPSPSPASENVPTPVPESTPEPETAPAPVQAPEPTPESAPAPTPTPEPAPAPAPTE